MLVQTWSAIMLTVLVLGTQKTLKGFTVCVMFYVSEGTVYPFLCNLSYPCLMHNHLCETNQLV